MNDEFTERTHRVSNSKADTGIKSSVVLFTTQYWRKVMQETRKNWYYYITHGVTKFIRYRNGSPRVKILKNIQQIHFE